MKRHTVKEKHQSMLIVSEDEVWPRRPRRPSGPQAAANDNNKNRQHVKQSAHDSTVPPATTTDQAPTATPLTKKRRNVRKSSSSFSPWMMLGPAGRLVLLALLSTCLSLRTTAGQEVCDAPIEGASSITLLKEEARTNQDDDRGDYDPDDNNCGLYLAPSSVRRGGWGVFTGRPLHVGDSVGGGDLCIPLIDLSWHVNQRRQPNHPFHKDNHDYVRDGSAVGMWTESARNDIVAFCPGLDSLIGHGTGRLTPNVDPTASWQYDENGGFRRRSSFIAAGSITPYSNVTATALTNVAPGSELFQKNYGKEEDWFGTYDDEDSDYSDDNGDGNSNHPARRPTVDWLRANGACLDHIRIGGASKIQWAGRGALATRHLPAGTVVTVSPLHVIPHRSILAMYKFVERKGGESEEDDNDTTTKKEWYRLVDESPMTQLLLNYCFGGGSIQVLLCPYGAGVNLINHDQLRANVKVEWATRFPALHNHSFVTYGTRDDLLSQAPRIAFQYVAVQDIAAGDELFMDYGNDWVAAWLKHAVHFNVSDDDPYIDARAYNDLFGDHPLRTWEQTKFDPYPKNLQLRCHAALLTQPVHMNATHVWSGADYGYPCQVLDYYREFGRELYTIEMEIPIILNETRGSGKQRIRITDVPRSGTCFFDRPYTSDIHQPFAFRHAIGLPRSMVAQQWMTAD